MASSMFRKKPIRSIHQESSLHRTLSAFDLVLFGIGAIIGAGIFVLTGIAAATKAGPGIIVSYSVAGVAALFAALAYAELAASIGGTGSAYSYAYAGFGEILAWLIGWDLLLEYSMGVSTVAIGWSSYVNNLFEALGIHLPIALTKNPFEGGWINLPAAFIVAALSSLLIIGMKQSARFNAAFVFVKLITIFIFIIVAAGHIDTQNWNNFFPFGWSGVMQGAALVFFAYIGFDALSTAVEETINPQRDLPIGILGSVIICSVLYIVVSALLTGIVPYTTLNVGSPVASALLQLGYKTAAGIIAAGAIAGLTTVMLVMYYGLTRISLAMARDGLLPQSISHIHPRTRTPIRVIIVMGIIIGLVSAFAPIERVAELVNIGTLAAFVFVSIGVIVFRATHPDIPRPFKLPFSPIIPLLGIFFCLYLLINLSFFTWSRFVVWMILGFIVYFCYGKKHSLLNKKN